MSGSKDKFAGIQLRDFETKRDVLKIAILYPDSPPRLYEINQVKDKSRWFCRLSPNWKFLHYGDIDDSMTPMLETLPEKLAISDIRDIVSGKNCPHIKNARTHKSTTELAFSILYDPDDALNFIAPDKETWCHWTDGFNALLGKPMVSTKATTDLDMLLTMEMKLRLLDLENIDIPEQPPPMPPLPKNYNFALQDL
nr:engulfment and cell motility protein 2 [Ciona intestinalis]|eukprot:XP_026693840.1 engulfment and cell motility protein 2 [Ciona intestinalis]